MEAATGNDCLPEAVDRKRMNAGGDDHAGRSATRLSEPMQIGRLQTVQNAKRQNRQLEVDPIWYPKPVQNRENFWDVVSPPKSEHQTIYGVGDRFKASLLIGRQPDQDEVVIIESRVDERRNQRPAVVVGDVPTKMTKSEKERQRETVLDSLEHG
jgi:hypothetical protein